MIPHGEVIPMIPQVSEEIFLKNFPDYNLIKSVSKP
jgi:hypothetical protein